MKNKAENNKVISLPYDKFFRCLADKMRIQILMLLWPEKELSLAKISAQIESSETQTARQIALLKKHGIVFERRHELQRFYRMNADVPTWAQKVLKFTYQAHRISDSQKTLASSK